MLTSIRTSMSKGFAKIITAVLMLILCLSFGIWGIQDMFRGGGSNDVASVGRDAISMVAFSNAYRERTLAITRQTNKAVTPDLARQYGLDKQILNGMIADSALDQQVGKFGLGLDNQKIVEAVTKEPMFQNSVAGQPASFDPSKFGQYIENNGLTEQGFFARQHLNYLRGQIDQAFAEGGPVPLTMQQAIARFGQEKRNVSYFSLPQTAVGDIPAPDQAALQSFYDENKGNFRTQEYRGLSYVLVTPADLAARAAVSDADVQAVFDKRNASGNSTEKRTIQQISFPTIDEAKAAAARIAAGQVTFEALATERKLQPGDINLGNLSRNQLNDPKIADAAFALASGATSGAVQGALANVILKVTAIDDGKDDIRKALIAQRSGEVLKDMRDSIDNDRMGGTSLKEIAAKLKLPVVTIPAIDRQGRDPKGQPVVLPLAAQALPNLFATESGNDPDTVDGRDAGLMWLSLDNITPARPLTLDEAKAEVAAAWTADQRVQRLKTKADDLVKQMKAGMSFDAAAKSVNQPVVPAWNLVRTGDKQPLPQATIVSIFATPLKSFGSTVAPNGMDRIIFHVEDSVIPEFDPKSAEAINAAKQLSTGIGQDLLTEYVRKVQDNLGVTINQANVDRVVGGGSGGF